MKKRKRKDSISTLLGPGSSIEGTIEFSGTIILDGHVKGKIFGKGGTLIVGQQANIEADILVDEAKVKGEVNGTINAKESIEVYPPGKVIGNIQAPVISIDTGAVFNGSCGMKSQTGIPEQTESDPQAAFGNGQMKTKF